ncbi:MAG: hypothetical protein CL524_04850 [Aequorivita sp.]|nr:hypothetical protein [Aequorivita sp.]
MATYGLGRELKFYLVKTTTTANALNGYGTSSQVALTGAANGAKVTSSTMDFSVAREDRMDARASRSVLERITGKQEISWSVETYMLPRGGSYVPNIGPMIECAMGSVSTVTYSLADTLPTLQMARVLPGVLREDCFGAYVDEMTVTASGADPIKLSFSGGAMEYALTGTGTTGTGATSTTMPVGTNEGFNFMPGSKIQIVDLTAASGTVVAGSSAHNSVTLAASTTFGSSKAITPHVPEGSYVTHGNPTSGITGSVSVNADTGLQVTGFDLTLTNNIKALSDEYGSKGTNDFIPGFRSVTGQVTVRCTAEDLKALTRRYQTAGPSITDGVPTFATVAIILTMGQTADKKQVITLPTCELDFAGIDIPESEEAILSIPFTALGSSGGDEFTFEWNNG